MQIAHIRSHRWFRLITHICRIIFALIFIFSGVVKSMDPWGTALSVSNYLVTYNLDWLQPLIMVISICLCGAELLMGCMLLFKVGIRMCSTFAALSMIFFTILTLLSATILPVEDCGCFGDVIKLTPWQSFFKNLALLPLIIIVWWRYRRDRMFAFSGLELLLTALFFSVSMGLGIYSYNNLPLVDLLPYKVGVNIEQAMEEARNHQNDGQVVLVYRNIDTGELKEFSIDDNAWQNDQQWEWVDTRVSESANDSVESMILEFYISDGAEEATNTLLATEGELYMLCITSRDNVSSRCEQTIAKTIEAARNNGATVVCLTPEPLTPATTYTFGNCAPVPCYNIDSKTMKTMLRANNGIVILTNGTITHKENLGN